MKILRAALFALATAASFQAMAQRQPVAVINYENIPVAASKPLPAEAVKQAIQEAATAKQWEISEPGPGRLVATLHVRGKHTVVTEIAYAPDKYSLIYRDSTNMKYAVGPDGKGMIHPFYNRWVGDLKDGIRVALSKN